MFSFNENQSFTEVEKENVLGCSSLDIANVLGLAKTLIPTSELELITKMQQEYKINKMNTIDTIYKLVDEMAVIAEISKELPRPYKNIIDIQIIGFKVYLSKILTIETEGEINTNSTFRKAEKNEDLQIYASDLLTELENQQFEE